MKRKYTKHAPDQNKVYLLLRPFYKVLYFFILFFIFIGDSVLFFFRTIFFGFFGLISMARKVRIPKLKFRLKNHIVFPRLRAPRLPRFTFSVPKLSLPKIAIPMPHLRFSPPRIAAPQARPIVIVIKMPFVRGRGRPKKPFLQRIREKIPHVSMPHISLPRITFAAITTRTRYFALGVLFAAIFTVFAQSYFFVKSLPSPRLIGSMNYPLTTHITDRNGNLLYEVYHDQNRTPVSLSKLPKYISQATISIEDKDFYHHNGVSLSSGIIRATKEILINHSFQGGSTITQQLVKSALLSPERTISRKVKEILLALWTEQLYSKNQILEMYLNQVAYGGSSYGIAEAAKTYFGKEAKDLTLDEAALLAGLPQAPSLYSPYTNPDAAIARRNEVLKKMYEQGYISADERNEAQAAKLSMVPLKTNIKAPHFVFYVKDQLEEKYGIHEVEEGGLKVTTSLDLNLQQEAEKILKEELEKVKSLDVTNGGIVVTKPSTGEILAMVGSADYFSEPSGAFNVATALRQPGSSIKPLMYSLALQRGYTAASIVDDSPVTFGAPGAAPYSPVNYDGKFHGRVPIRIALANSFNIPAVKVLNTLGVDQFVEYAKTLGISTWGDSSQFGLSLTLGGGEVTMVDMAKAYGVFANKGYRVDLTPIDKVEDPHGSVVESLSPVKTKVVDEANTFILSDILSDNFARQWEFGTHSALEIPGYKVAVKTGTTDNKKDNWTIGYTPDYTVVVWVGNNDGHTMNQQLASGITGAAPIWNRVMSYLLKNNSSNQWFQKPDNIVEQTCYFGRKEFFVKGTDKNNFCQRDIFETTKPSVKPSPVN